MSFINRNANLILLALIVLSALTLAGATVFFQKNFDDVNTRYNTKLAELNEITSQLTHYKEVLDQTKEEIDLLRLRDEDFTEKFTTVKDEKETLESLRIKLERERSELQADLTDTLQKYNVAKNELDEAKLTITGLAQERADLRAEVKSLKQQIAELELG